MLKTDKLPEQRNIKTSSEQGSHAIQLCDCF